MVGKELNGDAKILLAKLEERLDNHKEMITGELKELKDILGVQAQVDVSTKDVFMKSIRATKDEFHKIAHAHSKKLVKHDVMLWLGGVFLGGLAATVGWLFRALMLR